jgi:hypothetical protein
MIMVTVAKWFLTDVDTNLLKGRAMAFNGVGHLVCLRLVDKVHLACYLVIMEGTDGCHICFVARKYVSGETALLLDGLLLRITEVFFCDSPSKSMRALYN